jgi:hypothetical protein
MQRWFCPLIEYGDECADAACEFQRSAKMDSVKLGYIAGFRPSPLARDLQRLLVDLRLHKLRLSGLSTQCSDSRLAAITSPCAR